jgi:hypothetical protein
MKKTLACIMLLLLIFTTLVVKEEKMATITNNLKVHAEETTQKYTDGQYSANDERINGSQPGTTISSKLINTSLRQSTLITAAFVEALKEVLGDKLVTGITVGVDTTFDDVKTMFVDGLLKIKVAESTLADNVKSGAIVEETTRARESKPGYELSITLNEKLNFIGTWVGTYKNNDVIYYSTAGTLKGFYVVKNLNPEGLNAFDELVPAQTLTIGAEDTPTTHSAYLSRLTLETTIGSDVNLSKTDNVSNESTANELLTALGAYTNLQLKIPSGSGILTQTETDGVLGTLNKITAIDDESDDTDIPTGKAVYDLIHLNYTDFYYSTAVEQLFTHGSESVIGEITRVNCELVVADSGLPTKYAATFTTTFNFTGLLYNDTYAKKFYSPTYELTMGEDSGTDVLETFRISLEVLDYTTTVPIVPTGYKLSVQQKVGGAWVTVNSVSPTHYCKLYIAKDY